MRLRSAALDGVALTRSLEALGAMEGVTRVAFDATTGGVLIEYEPGRVDPDAILVCAAEASGLALETPSDAAERRRSAGVRTLISGARTFNARVHEVTGYRVEPRAVVPLALAGLAGVSFAIHPETRLPRWDNLAYWSFALFTQLFREEIDADALGDPAPASRGDVR